MTLIDIPDLIKQFGMLILFTFGTAQVYAQLFLDRSHLGFSTRLWWNVGSLSAGAMMGLVHFYSPIYRVKFTSDPVSIHFVGIDALLRTVLISATCGWIVIGGITSRLMFGSVISVASTIYSIPDTRFSWTDGALSNLLHIHVVCLISFLLLKAIESSIQILVAGRNLRITAELDQDAMACLYGGLTDPLTFAQEAAIYELFELVMFEDERRKTQLFMEPIADSMAVKEMVLFMLHYLHELIGKCREDLAGLRQLEQKLTGKNTTMLRESLSVRLRRQVSSDPIYAPPSPGFVDRVIGRVLASPANIKSRTIKFDQSKEPIILKPSNPETIYVQPAENALNPLLEYAPRLAKTSYGQALLVLWVNGHQRVRHLPKYQSIDILVSIIGAITVSSYEEDSHGQIQLILPDILQALTSFNIILKELDAPIRGFPQCPSSLVVESLQNTCEQTIKSIVDKFTMETLQSKAIRLSQSLLSDIQEIVRS